MVVYRCRNCGRPHTRSLDRHQCRRLYTPSMDAYQRFERAMVGLDVNAPAGRKDVRARAHRRRKKG